MDILKKIDEQLSEGKNEKDVMMSVVLALKSTERFTKVEVVNKDTFVAAVGNSKALFKIVK